jgi:hypothetical protein
VYASRYGRSQSLERLAARGGFGPSDLDMFVPGWRQRLDRVERLEGQLAALRTYRILHRPVCPKGRLEEGGQDLPCTCGLEVLL